MLEKMILNNIINPLTFSFAKPQASAFQSTGTVLTCKDGVVTVAGLWDVMIGRNSIMGRVSNLGPHSFSAIALGDESAVAQGDLALMSMSCFQLFTGKLFNA